jgi:hypothetical protein
MLYDPNAGQSTFMAFDNSLKIAHTYTGKSWDKNWQILIGAFLDRSRCLANHTCATGDDILVLNRKNGQIEQYVFSFPDSKVVAQYEGTIYNIESGLSSAISLTGIQQSQENISGYFNSLRISGSFKGSIDASSHIQFTVTDPTGHATLSFDGMVQSDHTLSGTYCSLNQRGICAGEYGLWSVAPALYASNEAMEKGRLSVVDAPSFRLLTTLDTTIRGEELY